MQSETKTKLRRALPQEAEALTELALRSKAHWGYDAAFLEECREALTVSQDDVERFPFFVAEVRGSVIGFYGLIPLATAVELAYLFVEPSAIGRGHGRRLFEHALASARKLGARPIVIESDPSAEGFYLAMGAERVGELVSPLRPGRILPILRFALATSGSSS